MINGVEVIKPSGIDIVIPLGEGSRYNDLELKYSLRSIEKHLSNYRNIYIVGELPLCINPAAVVYIPFDESPRAEDRSRNIYGKIAAAIKYMDVMFTQDAFDFVNDLVTVGVLNLSDYFLYMNDDHYLLRDYDLKYRFPSYHRGEIDLNKIPNEAQTIQMRNTLNSLQTVIPPGVKALDYDVHCPISFNKESFINSFEVLPEPWPDHGYGIKSYYSNSILREGTEARDLKFTEPAVRGEILYKLEGREWFSIGDRCLLEGDMFKVLEELYPLKSKYEL